MLVFSLPVVHQNDLNPVFEETLVFPCRDRNATISVTVEDKGLLHKCMGRVELPVSKYRMEKVRMRCGVGVGVRVRARSRPSLLGKCFLRMPLVCVLVGCFVVLGERVAQGT